MDSDFDRGVAVGGGGQSYSASTRTPAGERVWRARPLLVTGMIGVIAGGLVAAAVAHAPTSVFVWLAAYLVLVVGVAQIAFAVGQALLAEPAAGRGLIHLECALFNLGSVGVIAGTLAGRFMLVLFGTIMILGALVAFLLAVRSRRTGYVVRLYQGLIGVVAAGACIGLILSGLGANS